MWHFSQQWRLCAPMPDPTKPAKTSKTRSTDMRPGAELGGMTPLAAIGTSPRSRPRTTTHLLSHRRPPPPSRASLSPPLAASIGPALPSPPRPLASPTPTTMLVGRSARTQRRDARLLGSRPDAPWRRRAENARRPLWLRKKLRPGHADRGRRDVGPATGVEVDVSDQGRTGRHRRHVAGHLGPGRAHRADQARREPDLETERSGE